MVKKAFKFLKRTLTKPEGIKFDSTAPVSRYFGYDRGTPIDRYYINNFLKSNQQVITGTVLEIAESTYSKKYGVNVSNYEVFHVTDDSPNATIIGDLTDLNSIPENKIDCFICTQTFNFIYDFKAAIMGTYQLLKSGGILLATVAGISQISKYDMDRWGDYWRFTTLSVKKVFGEVFGDGNIQIDFYGNCFAAMNFLRGISVEELSIEKLDVKDADYPLVITVIAKKVVLE